MQKEPAEWRQILRKNFTDWKTLADFLELSSDLRQKIDQHPRFPLNLPLRLAKKIAKNRFDDPILKQFLPSTEENFLASGFCSDPVKDKDYQVEAKFLKKYAGRALLLCSSACAMHCRYCFRQNFPYERQKAGFSPELAAIQKDTSLNEIILSGGDPLSLDDGVLNVLLDELENISHVRRIRFHTRFPIGIPERLSEEFLKILTPRRFQLWFVLHINHPNELDEDLFLKVKKLQCLGIPVLSQSVLLKGVNDNLEVQKSLCESLVDHGVMPYYLYQLDRVQGTAHFEVDRSHGKALIQNLSALLSGYAIPKYVSEVPGANSKIPLNLFV